MIEFNIRENYGTIIEACTERLTVGRITIYPTGRVCDLRVHTSFRREHIGTALIHKAFEVAKTMKLKEISLFVDQSNKIAIGLYQSLGFKKIVKEYNCFFMTYQLGG